MERCGACLRPVLRAHLRSFVWPSSESIRARPIDPPSLPSPFRVGCRPFSASHRRRANLKARDRPRDQFKAQPASEPSPATSISAPKMQQLAASLRRAAPSVTETYIAYGTTKGLYNGCAAPGIYTVPQAGIKGQKIPKNPAGEDIGVGEGPWHTQLGLPATFSTWSQITMLHIYLLCARFRMFEAKVSKTWAQHLLDHFFFDAEEKMERLHNITQRSLRQAYLKDIFVQYRGAVAAYDEGISRGDAVLATALWRNLYGGRKDVNAEHLAIVVSYMRRQLQRLDLMTDERVTVGRIKFGDFEEELPIVARPAPEASKTVPDSNPALEKGSDQAMQG